MSMVGLLQMGLLAWLLFIVVASLLIAFVYPLIREQLRSLPPEVRVVVLRGFYVAPFVGGLVATVLCFVPKALGVVFPRLDHCPDHADGHVHFCLTHPPQTLGEANVWLLIAALGLAYLAVVSKRLARYASSHRALRQLTRTSRLDSQCSAWVVESDLPLAITVGAFHPRTVLSSGLLRVIPSRLVEAIVAHEKAHERRRDSLWRAATGLVALCHLPGTRHTLESDLELACEQACDEEAGSLIGDRVRVAQALVAVARVRQDSASLGTAVLAFGERGVGERVQSLLAPPPRSVPSNSLVWCLVVMGGLTALLSTNQLHHVTESLLGLLLG